MRTLLLSGTIGLWAAACAVLALPTPAAASSPTCSKATELQTMLCLVNQARGSHALRPVRVSPLLGRSAQLRANAIVRCRQFSHTPCGQSFGAVFQAVGYTRGRYSVGENLAWGIGSQASPTHTIQRWLASPAHRRVLFSPRWREFGLSFVEANSLFAPGANRLWVAQFGRRS